MAMWKAGDRAECVDDSPCQHCGEPVGVQLGLVYGVLRVCGADQSGSVGLILEEARTSFGHSPAFSASRFRKVVDDDCVGARVSSSRVTVE